MQKHIYLLLIIVACIGCKKENTTQVNNNYIVATDAVLGSILRTPNTRFDNLKDYNFKENYITIANTPLRMHYIDEGPATGKIILLLHGNPAWVYNFRHLIPQLVAKGYRVIAPDLIGFGKSDKPADKKAHTYDNHTIWLTKFITQLNLQNINVHMQDWGGLLGLRVVIQNPNLFTKVAVSNTSLPDGTNNNMALQQWVQSSQTVATYGFVIERGTYKNLTTEEEAAYDAPFVDESFKAAPRQFPLNIPVSPINEEAIENQQLWQLWKQWQKPFLTIFSDTDPISEGEQKKFIDNIPGAANLQHQIVPNTNHYIREDEPILMANYLSQFFN